MAIYTSQGSFPSVRMTAEKTQVDCLRKSLYGQQRRRFHRFLETIVNRSIVNHPSALFIAALRPTGNFTTA